jgi:transcriptional regulator with XRE-family HTH domain
MKKSHESRRDSVPTPGEVFARRIREVRSRRGLSQQTVVERLRALGIEKMDQTIVSRIESGARRVTLDEALALALALDVSPVSLYLPHGEEERVRLTPGRVEDAETAWAWATAREPLPDMHAETFYAERSEAARMTDARAALVARLHEQGDE